jgi:hypothetical protein
MGKKKPTLCSLERSVEEIARKHHYAFEKDLWRGFLETTTSISIRKTTTLLSNEIWGEFRETTTVLSTEICSLQRSVERELSKETSRGDY